jgi:hypothetical protein
LSWGIQPAPPADVARLDGQPHLIPQPALFELVTPKGLGIALCNLKVGSINQQQTIPPNISLLPVLELDLGGKIKDESRFDK